jgi:predicted nucleic acid-binding protein
VFYATVSNTQVKKSRRFGNALRGSVPLLNRTNGLPTASDPDDDRVLECAVAAQAGFIVTGDNALLRLNPFRNVQIVTAAQFLDRKPWIIRPQAE